MNIIGISVRLPGHHANDSFWRGLEAGESFMGELSAERWGLMSPRTQQAWGAKEALHGMFLDDVDKFDRRLFELAPSAVMFADPRQRILLEATWEAFENAGLKASDLRGQRVGVFIAHDGLLGDYFSEARGAFQINRSS